MPRHRTTKLESGLLAAPRELVVLVWCSAHTSQAQSAVSVRFHQQCILVGGGDTHCCCCFCRFYGGTPQLKAAYSMRPGAEADDSYGVIEYGSCGFTNSDGTLAYPKEMYAALAGKCGIIALSLRWQPAHGSSIWYALEQVTAGLGAVGGLGLDAMGWCYTGLHLVRPGRRTRPLKPPLLFFVGAQRVVYIQTPTGTMAAAVAVAMRCAASLALCRTRALLSRPHSSSTWARPTPTSAIVRGVHGQVRHAQAGWLLPPCRRAFECRRKLLCQAAHCHSRQRQHDWPCMGACCSA